MMNNEYLAISIVIHVSMKFDMNNCITNPESTLIRQDPAINLNDPLNKE